MMYQDKRDGRLLRISEATVNKLPHEERKYFRPINIKPEIPIVLKEKLSQDHLLSVKELKEKYPEINEKTKKGFLKALGHE